MSDFILDYEILEAIAKNSKSLGKHAEGYSESLHSKMISEINQVTGGSSGYLINASDMVRDKINALKQKSDAFYSFAEQVTNLLTVAEQIDQEVADAIAASREYFLDHHQSLRIEDWKVNLLDFLVDIKNSIPFLNLLADIFKGLEAVFESLKDAVKHWYECGGGKYIGEIVASIGLVALAVVGMVGAVAALAVTGVGFFAVCGIIGATIALVNSVTNVATSFRAADAALDGNPAMAVIYGKQDKLSDVIRQTNFGDGTLNTLSNLGAGALDATETICDIVGIAEMAGIAKMFKGDIFKKLKNGTLSFSDLKNSAKNGIVDLKTNIKNGYADFKNGSKLDDIGAKGGSNSSIYDAFSKVDTPEARYDFLLDKAKTMDVSTPKNGAIFYAGRVDTANGTITARQMAEKYADQLLESKGVTKFTLEKTPGGKWMDDLKLYDKLSDGKFKYESLGLNKSQADNLWNTLSGRYANGASGAVTAFVKNVPDAIKPKTVFYSTEFPNLRFNNDMVTHINIR